MKSKELHIQLQNTSMRTNSECDGSQRNVPSIGNETDRGHQQERLPASGAETNLQDGINSCPIKPTQCCSLDVSLEQSVEDSDKIFVDALFEGTWRPPIPSVSSESIDSEISSTSLDPVTSLGDDVFDDLVDSVLDEMDTFGSPTYSSLSAPTGIPMPNSGPFITPSTLRMDENQPLGYNGLYQLPNANATGHSFDNSFQGFNFGLTKGLQNPSRGLITVMRRLCDLLSKPRSDYLDSVFVRLLNNALKEMEDAAEPQNKRLKTKVVERHTVPKRRRIKPRKSTLDGNTWSQPTNIGPKRSLPFQSQAYLSAISKGGESTYTETVDLTSEEDNEKEDCYQKQDRHAIQNESFIALEDTMSNFMDSLFY